MLLLPPQAHVIYIECYDSVCFLSAVFTSRCVGKFDTKIFNAIQANANTADRIHSLA